VTKLKVKSKKKTEGRKNSKQLAVGKRQKEEREKKN
jgi:hypothetical protein